MFVFEGTAELPDGAEPGVEFEGKAELPEGMAYALDEEPAELEPTEDPTEDTGNEVGTESVFEEVAELPDVAEGGLEFEEAAELPGGMAYPLERPAELGPAEDTGKDVGTESVFVFEGINIVPPELERELYTPDEAPFEAENTTVVVETGVPGNDAVTNTVETGTSEPGVLIELMLVSGGLKVGRALD